MTKYSFQYWFEWGCSENFCPCLWSADQITKNKFGYAVDLHRLPISQDLIHFLCQLGIEHDNALDWEYPPNPLLWSDQEKKEFYQKAREGCFRLQKELGKEYQIIYCEEE
ncbi:MAG: hypothetical protein IJ642_00965 [Oscillospiraceae bacterium]|nr:hypothetical protein [Oscillospiraceae bacterium]